MTIKKARRKMLDLKMYSIVGRMIQRGTED